VARGKRAAQPRELIRLSPGQFSAAVAITVLLVGAGFLTGYILGVRSAGYPENEFHLAGSGGEAVMESPEAAMESPAKPEPAPTLTFYTELTEDRNEKAPVRKPAKKEAVSKPPAEKAKPGSETRVESGERAGTGDGVMVQAGSFPERDKAETYLKGLYDHGYSGVVAKADLGPRGIWYRVQLGPYPDESRARKALDRLQKEMSIKGFIVR